MNTLNPVLRITNKAALYIKDLLHQEPRTIGIKVSIIQGGCSGYKYQFGYMFKGETDNYEPLNDNGVKVFVEKSTLLKIFGSIMDYEDTLTKSGFFFHNPNTKATCGCGESIAL